MTYIKLANYVRPRLLFYAVTCNTWMYCHQVKVTRLRPPATTTTRYTYIPLPHPLSYDITSIYCQPVYHRGYRISLLVTTRSTRLPRLIYRKARLSPAPFNAPFNAPSTPATHARLTSIDLPSNSGSLHFACMNVSALYCSLRVSISPIFRNTTRSSTITCTGGAAG